MLLWALLVQPGEANAALFIIPGPRIVYGTKFPTAARR
jgi:hypothetical protein